MFNQIHPETLTDKLESSRSEVSHETLTFRYKSFFSRNRISSSFVPLQTQRELLVSLIAKGYFKLLRHQSVIVKSVVCVSNREWQKRLESRRFVQRQVFGVRAPCLSRKIEILIQQTGQILKHKTLLRDDESSSTRPGHSAVTRGFILFCCVFGTRFDEVSCEFC